MKVSRRVFLGTAVGGTLAVLVGGVLVPLPAVAGMRVLSSGEHETLAAILDALYPAGVLGPSAAEAQVATQMDAHMANMLGREQHLMRLFLRLMEQRSRLDAGSRFTRLPLADRVELLNRWEAVGDVWSLGVKAVRALSALFYFNDERVMTALNWGVGCAAWGPTPGFHPEAP